MNRIHFDSITKMFASRKESKRLTRRAALAYGFAAVAAVDVAVSNAVNVSAQDAIPAGSDPEPDAEHGPMMLFVQSYQSGSIVPKEGEDGRYTVTLEQGHGQTIHFSDRPDRIVGTSPTPQFLEGLGFVDNNPPNAALVFETSPGETDIAVVELFNPLYDPLTHGVTYEVEVLANWQAELEMDFTEAPTDLTTVASSFGSAHLFIDDCPDGEIVCHDGMGIVGLISNAEHDGYCFSYNHWTCLPCSPWYDNYTKLFAYWTRRCNQTFSMCGGQCAALHLCSTGGWRCEIE